MTITYQSTTMPKGRLIPVAVVGILWVVAVMVVPFTMYGRAVLFHEQGDFYFWLWMGGFFLGLLLIFFAGFGNVTATWEISEIGISESITPKWKRLPFGVYQQRFVSWDRVASVDASASVGSVLGTEEKYFVIRLHDGHPVRIHKNKRLGDEYFNVVLAAVRSRGASTVSAGKSGEAITQPRQEVPTEKGFWKKPFGRIVAVLLAVFALTMVVIDLMSEGELSGVARFRIYFMVLPIAAIAGWLAFSPDKKDR